MKVILIIAIAALLSACHTAPVQCDARLTPINPAPPAASDSKGDGPRVPTAASLKR